MAGCVLYTIQKPMSEGNHAADSKKLAELVEQEFQVVRKELRAKVQEEENMTMNADGWGTTGNDSVYTCSLVFQDRTCHVWDSVDMSGVPHTAINIAGNASHPAHGPHLILALCFNGSSPAVWCCTSFSV